MSIHPYYEYDTGAYVTQGISVTDTSVSQNFFGRYSYRYEERKKVETKQEKLDRISKQKALASWKKYDDKNLTIKQISQMCKPVHKISNGAFRGLR